MALLVLVALVYTGVLFSMGREEAREAAQVVSGVLLTWGGMRPGEPPRASYKRRGAGRW